MFSLTQAAAQQIQQAASASDAADLALRIAAKVDTDGSLQYGMGFDEPKDEDMRLDLRGVAVVIGGESQQLLFDTVLDFVELTPGAFHFILVKAMQARAPANQRPWATAAAPAVKVLAAPPKVKPIESRCHEPHSR